ncbi:MAG: class I SAM-dependent methyltransferase [Dehalococcoidia bacterium]|jgi:methyltransferase (TIGR00027 family)
MENSGLFDVKISDISSTMLITLYCRALESRSRNPIINDPQAVRIVDAINSRLAGSEDRLYRELAQGKLDKKLVMFISLRARRFDDYARAFLPGNPGGTIVNLGCGLDTRFWRIDDGKTGFYDLDLPEVIEIKRKLCRESERYHMIASSALDYNWLSLLKTQVNGPVLFLAEGLFMYLEKKDVRELVLKLQSSFPGSELVCEVVNESMVHGWLKGAMNMRMHKQLHVGGGVTFLSGIKDGKEIESWSPGIRLMDEWSYFDSAEKKLGPALFFGKIPGMRRVQWIVHYKLG